MERRKKIEWSTYSIIKKLVFRNIVKENTPFSRVQSLMRSLLKKNNTLTEREKDILEKRILQGMSQRAIGRQYKISGEAIRHVENRAFIKLTRGSGVKEKP